MELKERTHQERVILQEYMKISEVMRALGDESVRKEFSKGENEALVISLIFLSFDFNTFAILQYE